MTVNENTLPIQIDIFNIGSLSKRTTKPIIGIYRITSPVGKIYVGKSADIEVRFLQYRGDNVSEEVYNSFMEYGIKNHTFEIIHTCESVSVLSELETKYIDQFDCIYPKGLNKNNVGSNGRPSKMERLIKDNDDLTREVSELRNLNRELIEKNDGSISVDFKAKLINAIDENIKTSFDKMDAVGYLWYSKLKEFVSNVK